MALPLSGVVDRISSALENLSSYSLSNIWDGASNLLLGAGSSAGIRRCRRRSRSRRRGARTTLVSSVIPPPHSYAIRRHESDVSVSNRTVVPAVDGHSFRALNISNFQDSFAYSILGMNFPHNYVLY